jgi:PKD repeat protein
MRVYFNNTGNTSWTVPPGVTAINYMVVAGGGSGDNPNGGTGGGGGGAGGFLYGFNLSVIGGTTLNMSVGAGGVGNINGVVANGGDTFMWNQSNNMIAATHAVGGSHGGDTSGTPNGGSTGGTRTGVVGTPTAGQGNYGYATGETSSPFEAGGGGGAGNASVSLNGGDDIFFWITGVNLPYSGGGGGGSYASTPGSGSAFGTGGAGGHNTAGISGTANRGGGGGGSGLGDKGPGNGGSGVIVITYMNSPLSASFTTNVTSGISPPTVPVQFTDTSMGGPVDWNYTFQNVTGNNTPVVFSQIQNPIYSFGIGNWSTTLQVQNATGTTLTSSATFINISTSVITPVANFTGTPTVGTQPLTVNFYDASTNTPTSWNYSFGDGTFSTAQNPTHTYLLTGYETVNLTATNAQGNSTLSRTNYIAVNPMIPTVTTNVTSGYNSVPVHFTGSTTGQADSYFWMLGSGHGTSVAQNPPDQTYTAGTYLINFSVTNNTASVTYWNNNTVIIVQNNPTPVASFSVSTQNTYVPATVQFTDTSLFGPTSWQWNYTNISGNNLPTTFSTSQNPTYTFSKDGTYSIKLTSTNVAGSNSSTLNYIVISAIPLAPQANFTYTGQSGSMNLPVTVTFQDASTQSPSSWYWSNFGDGSGATSLLQNPTHNYTSVGAFPVTLSVTNANGTPSQITKYVQVTINGGGVTDTVNHIGSTTTETLTGYGTYAWTCPSGVYSLNYAIIGGGAAGSNGGHIADGTAMADWPSVGGSNGTFYSSPSAISVTPGVTYQFVIGKGGTNVRTALTYQLIGSTVYWNVTRGGLIYNSGTGQGTGQGTYYGTDPLAGGFTSAFSNSVNGGTSGLQYVQGYQYSVSGISLGNNGPGNNGVVSPISGNYVTYSGGGGNYANAGGTGGGGNGYLYNLQSSTAGSQFGAGGGGGGVMGGFNDTGNNGANGAIILNYMQQAVILPPVAQFTASPLNGTVPFNVQFTDLSTNGPTSWSWNFGDGGTDIVQNPVHTYTTAGSYTVTLTDYNTNQSGNGNIAKTNYINASNVVLTPAPTPAQQSNQVWYQPMPIGFYVVDQSQNPLLNAVVSAQFISSSGLPQGVSDLINNYGMNLQAANEAVNGTLFMNTTTDGAGRAVITMLPALTYNVLITSGGVTNTFTINPISNDYKLTFISNTAPKTDAATCVFSNGNTWTGAYNNINVDPYNITLMYSYQDTCGLTSSVNYYAYDQGNDVTPANNLIYQNNLANVGTGTYVLNITVKNTKGENYLWYQNYTRSV